MNNQIKNTFRTGLVALATLVAAVSCSDTWDEHYESAPNLTYDGVVIEYIRQNSDLSDFYEVLKATGYDRELNGAQVMTVLAPQNGTFDKAALLADVAAGKRQSVIDRFVKNHILRYNFSLTNEEQRVALLNTKTILFGTLAENTIQNVEVAIPNIACNKGVVQVLTGAIPYTPNIYEYLSDQLDEYKAAQGMTDADENPISLFSFFAEYDNDLLDEARSVKSGDVDSLGNIVYADSVMTRNNTLATTLDTYIFREDSNYAAIIPTVEAYQKRYEEVKKYLNFNMNSLVQSGTAEERQHDYDSIQNYYANMFTMSDLFYNMNTNRGDSLVSTSYKKNNWKYGVYYPNGTTPEREEILKDAGREFYGDVFAGATKVDCSNGAAYLVDNIPYTIYDNFVRKIVVEGEGASNVERGTDSSGARWTDEEEEIAIVTVPYRGEATDISGGTYAYISNPSSRTKKVTFAYKVPNTLSGKYNIYARFLPLSTYYDYMEDASSASRPVRFRVYLYEKTADGELTTKSTGYTRLHNPAESGTNYNFETSADEVTTIKLAEAVELKNCYYGDNYGVLLGFETNTTTSQINNGTYINAFCLDCIIFEPCKEDTDNVTE
ncbi:MAG: fasciclin domain-containing protein [Prevotellaceae bacterium]|nr:fasciclin domain-containing protein [Prevotellaceae bacterium]